MIRWLVLILIILAASNTASPAQYAAASTAVGTTISGGDLAHPVRLTATDEDAFVRRINSPPRLDERPDRATGPTYTLTSPYWSAFLSRPDREPIEDEATYFVDSGIVLARYGSEEAWLALDLRQQAILDRYIRLAQENLVAERPGLLNLLAEAQVDEPITLEAAGEHLTAEAARTFWSGVSGITPQFLEVPQPPSQQDDGYWLVFGLQEGRTLQAFYKRGASPEIIDSLGSERYSVPPAVAALLNGIDPAIASIDDANRPGSYLWWALAIVVAGACFGAAIWFQRHPLPFLR